MEAICRIFIAASVFKSCVFESSSARDAQRTRNAFGFLIVDFFCQSTLRKTPDFAAVGNQAPDVGKGLEGFLHAA